MDKVKQSMLEITNPDGLQGNLADAMRGADVFIGLSAAGIVSPRMVRSMAHDPIVFAMANPDPEIMPEDALLAGAVIVGTGRSDFPNQINNCLAFPGIFRGALNCRATAVTTRMKLAAAQALAGVVGRPVLERIVPEALDTSVVPAVAAATARAWQERVAVPS